MVSRRLREFDSKIAQRPEVKILVYFAVILALASIPYICVVYKGHALHDYSDVVEEGIVAAAAVAAIYLMRNTPNALPLPAYGLSLKGVVTQTAMGAGIGLALMSAIVNVLRFTGHYVVERQNLAFSPWHALALYLFVAIFEETVFRGFIFVTLEQKWGTFVGLTTTSLLFGLSHLVDSVPGINFIHHLRAAIFIGLEAGILLNAAFILTRSLWLSIGIHWAWNFFEGPFYGTNVSGMTEPSLYVAHTAGRTIITGGGFGPEAGIVCLIICTTAGVLMTLQAVRAGKWRANPEIEIERPSDDITTEKIVY